MTDNEIIKALECCGDENNCAECPLKGTRFEFDRSCEQELMKASAELIKSKNEKINELQHKIMSCNSEIERLEYTLIGVMHSVDKWLDGGELEHDEVNRAATMREKTLQIVERLQKAIKVQDIMIEQQEHKLKNAKSEGRKEFADRLKTKATSAFWEERKYVDTEDIDNTLKEMAGETNGGE